MRKQYDDFTQLKLKDMGKAMSDMTYKYINPETNEPTKVPPKHYEDILEQVTENYIGEATKRQFLVIMYNQLSSLKKEDEKYFNQALMCIDLGINPKDLRIDEDIALNCTYDGILKMKSELKKDFHLLNDYIVDAYNEVKRNPEIQRQIIQSSNMQYERDNYIRKNNGYER